MYGTGWSRNLVCQIVLPKVFGSQKLVFASFYVTEWEKEFCKQVADDDETDLDDCIPRSKCILLFDVRRILLKVSAEK